MEKINLFAADIWKTKILPEEYNKDEIIKTVEKNYKISPDRKTKFYNSESHHYYEDWNNQKFEKINFDRLSKKYHEILNSFFQKQKCKQFTYRYTIVNVAVYGKNQFMEEHDHLHKENNTNSFYSCVHYIKFKKQNSPLTFINPNTLSHYKSIFENIREVVDVNDTLYSQYFSFWNLDIEEDDFIMFPSYLRHSVSKNETDDLRISIVTNVDIQI